MANVNDTDTFLVNRNNTSYQVEAQNLMADLQDNDLMLVNRSGTSYKVTGADMKESLNPTDPPVLGSVTLTEDSPGGDRYTNQAFTTAITVADEGRPAANLAIRAKLDAKLVDKLTTSPIETITTKAGDWNTISGASEQVRWTGIAYGEYDGVGRFVAVSWKGTNSAMWSEDGFNWNIANMPNNQNWQDVAYAGDRFIAIANQGTPRSAQSKDGGVTWTEINTLSTGNTWAACAGGYIPGYGWVVHACANDSRVAYLRQGSDGWTNQSTSGYWRGTGFGNNIFVTVGDNNANWIDSGGSGINSATIPSGSWEDCAYGNGVWVAVASGMVSNSPLAISYDNAQSWERVEVLPPGLDGQTLQCITYGQGKFVALGFKIAIFSYDGLNWEFANMVSPPEDSVKDVAYGGAKFIGVTDLSSPTNNLVWSPSGGPDYVNLEFETDQDLANFKPEDSIEQEDGAASGTAGEIDVAGKSMDVSPSTGVWIVGKTVTGPRRTISTGSISGSTYNQATTANGKYYMSEQGMSSDWLNNFQFVGYPGGSEVMLRLGLTGRGDPIRRSTDLTNWDAIPAAGAYNMIDGIWIESLQRFICVGYNQGFAARGILYSDDGGNNFSHLADHHIPNDPFGGVGWDCISYSPDLDKYLVGRRNQLFYKTGDINGDAWTLSSQSSNGKMFWALGKFWFVEQTSVYYSETGEGRTRVAIPLFNNSYRYLVYYNNMFVISGNNCFGYSYDGEEWFESEKPPVGNWSIAAYHDGVWISGNTNQNPSQGTNVAFSLNGRDWFQVPSVDSYTGYQQGQWPNFFANKWVIPYPSSGKNNLSTNGYGSNTVLTMANSTGLDAISPGDRLDQTDGGAYGCVISVNTASNQITVAGTEGTWVAGQTIQGPVTPVAKEVTLYGQLNNNLQIVDLTSNDPGFTPIANTSPKIQFPPLFPNGAAPDTTLLPGTTIQTRVEADNLVFPAVLKDSNVVNPSPTRSTDFDLNDPAQVAEFDALEASLEGYEQDRDTKRANLKAAMEAANFTAEDIAVADLHDA